MHATRATGQRQGFRALSVRRVWLKRWVERAPVAVCVVAGEERRITLANAAFRELVSDDRLVGRPLREFMPACAAALAEDSARQTLSGGKSLHVVGQVTELSQITTYAQGLWLVCPLAEPDNQPRLLLLGSTANPSQQVQRASNLRASAHSLAQIVHELRAPLAPMRAAIALLKSCDPALLERVSAVLDRQVESMSRLVHDLYELASGERTQLALLRDRIAVEVLVERAVELALPLLQARRHSLHVHVEPGIWLEVDPGRVVQVLANLLINAAKYTDVGGTIWLDARMAGGQIVCASVTMGLA